MEKKGDNIKENKKHYDVALKKIENRLKSTYYVESYVDWYN